MYLSDDTKEFPKKIICIDRMGRMEYIEMKHDFAPNARRISALPYVNDTVKHVVEASLYYDTEPRKSSSCILTDLKQAGSRWL